MKAKIWLFMLLLVIGTAQAAMLDNLAAYYKLDSTTGITAIDSLNLRNATGINTPTWAAGKISNAIQLNPASSEYAWNNTNLGFVQNGNITMTAWINTSVLPTVLSTCYPTTGQSYSIMTKNDDIARITYNLNLCKNNSGVQTLTALRNKDGVLSEFVPCAVTFPVNSWHFVGMTYDNTTGNLSIYVNGTSSCSKILTGYGSAAGSADYFVIGAGASDGSYAAAYFNGTIDEVGVWNRKLSSDEMLSLYKSGNGLSYPFVLGAPVITQNTYNLTVALPGENSTAWRDNISNKIKTIDETPTLTFSTLINAHCRINKADQNWTTMGNSRNCSTTGLQSHICTLAANDSLVAGNGSQYLYIGCIDTSYTYESTNSTSGSLNISLVYTNMTAGILDISLNPVINLTEGQEFKPFANYTYLNGTPMGPATLCYFNLSNVSVEYYYSGSNTTLCTSGCSYNNRSRNITTDFSVALQDTIRLRLCHLGSPKAFTVSMTCAGGTSYLNTFASGQVVSCSAGTTNLTIDHYGCKSSSNVTLSIWSAGINAAQGLRIVDDFQGIDRWINENNTELPYLAPYGIYTSNLTYEYYNDGNKQLNVTCTDYVTTDNNQTTFFVNNRNPSAAFSSISTYYASNPLVDYTQARYPVTGTLNISFSCADDDFSNYSLKLHYDTGGLIDSFVGLSNFSTRQYVNTNFSLLSPYLDGTLGYYANLTCYDSAGLSATAKKTFYAIDSTPLFSWLNASGSIAVIPAYLNYSCLDTENQTYTTYVFVNGTLNYSATAETGYVFNRTIGYYNVTGYCGDGIRNSTPSSIFVQYTTLCTHNSTSLCDGCRYQDTTLTGVGITCLNGLSITDCVYSINDYANVSMGNCSSNISMLLESGWNKVSLSVKADGVWNTQTYNVWAKRYDSDSFSDYIVIIVGMMMMIACFVAGGILQNKVLTSLSGFIGVVVGYEIISFSIIFGALFIIISGLFALGVLMKK